MGRNPLIGVVHLNYVSSLKSQFQEYLLFTSVTSAKCNGKLVWVAVSTVPPPHPFARLDLTVHVRVSVLWLEEAMRLVEA